MTRLEPLQLQTDEGEGDEPDDAVRGEQSDGGDGEMLPLCCDDAAAVL